MSKSRRYISIIITALVVAWVTFGDCIFPSVKASILTDKQIAGMDFHTIHGITTTVPALTFWILYELPKNLGIRIIIFSPIIALGTTPICVFWERTDNLASFHPGYVLLALLILASKIAIWRYWWKLIILRSYATEAAT